MGELTSGASNIKGEAASPHLTFSSGTLMLASTRWLAVFEVNMKTSKLKQELIKLIGDLIDEETIPDCNSFIEMDQAVIHYAGDGGERYFLVTLTETTEDEYFKPYKG